MKNTRLPGHELLLEGAPFDIDGRRTGVFLRAGGTGRGRCSCGATSGVMTSANQRKKWHREHKDELRGQG